MVALSKGKEELRLMTRDPQAEGRQCCTTQQLHHSALKPFVQGLQFTSAKPRNFLKKMFVLGVFLLLFVKFPSIQEESLPNTHDRKYNQKIVDM